MFTYLPSSLPTNVISYLSTYLSFIYFTSPLSLLTAIFLPTFLPTYLLTLLLTYLLTYLRSFLHFYPTNYLPPVFFIYLLPLLPLLDIFFPFLCVFFLRVLLPEMKRTYIIPFVLSPFVIFLLRLLHDTISLCSLCHPRPTLRVACYY